MPSAALLGAGGARDADVAEQVLPGDTSPSELKLLGLGVSQSPGTARDATPGHRRRRSDRTRPREVRPLQEADPNVQCGPVLLGGMPTRTGFADLFDVPGGAPNAIQRRAALETPLDEPLVIIESETGSGKTEAALWRFARMYEAGLVDRLYFALPTRSAASQLHARVNRFIARMFPEEQRPEPVLAVPGYLKAGDFTGKDRERPKPPADTSTTHQAALDTIADMRELVIPAGQRDHHDAP